MLEKREVRGVRYLVSDMLRSTHAFSTRIGGVSTCEHTSSLNLAFGLGDTRKTVLENIRIFSDAAGFDRNALISVPQVHSSEVLTVRPEHAGAGVSRETDMRLDGYVSAAPKIPIGVKTADCVPILLEARDARGEVIAVGALHAGWRGTAARICERGVEALCALGADPCRIYAAIGPCIGSCCYEIRSDLSSKIEELLGENYCIRHIRTDATGRMYADLRAMNADILCECGVPRENIDVSDLCTYCSDGLFYSHRRQCGKRGSMMSVIVK